MSSEMAAADTCRWFTAFYEAPQRIISEAHCRAARGTAEAEVQPRVTIARHNDLMWPQYYCKQLADSLPPPSMMFEGSQFFARESHAGKKSRH
jgi:hypothetical protein